MKITLVLPSASEALFKLRLTKVALVAAIKRRRKAIRKHRDQKLDDRCWLDDDWLYMFLDDSAPPLTRLPQFDLMLNRCKLFYVYRRCTTPDQPPKDAIYDRKRWDSDLLNMTRTELLRELILIQTTLCKHRDIETVARKPREIEDDRKLYRLLPEKIPADFRLPPREEFIGEAKAPHAGCPSFWRSHAECKGNCNLHAWGPFKEKN